MLQPSVQAFLIPSTIYSGDNFLTNQHNKHRTMKLVLLNHETYSITTTERSEFGVTVKTCDPLCCRWKAPLESVSSFSITYVEQFFEQVDYIKIANEYINYDRAFPMSCSADLSVCICPSRVSLLTPNVME